MIAFSILVTGLLGTSPCTMPHPQDPWKKPDRAKVTKALREAVTQNIRDRKISAIMVAVVVDKKIFLAHAEGKVGKERRADAATLFPIGDVSRAISNLTFARLHANRELDLGRKVNDVMKPFVLRDDEGTAVDVTLADVLHGRVRLPRYKNFFGAAEVSKWTARRAVVEHAFVPGGKQAKRFGYSLDYELEYGLLQHAAQSITETSWNALVHRNVAKPLELSQLIPDARTGLPSTAASLYRKGFLGMWVREKHVHSSLAAAQGAWINAGDLGRLLLALLDAAGGAADEGAMRQLARTRPEFGSYLVSAEPHPHLELYAKNPGMSGGLALYPQFGRAWAVFKSSRRGNEMGMPGIVRATLERRLLPKPPERANQWNTAVGLGGGAGGWFVKAYPPAMRGEWTTTVRFRGKDQTLRMWLGERRVTHTQYGDGRRISVRSTRLRKKLTVRGASLIPVRDDINPQCEMVLHESGEGKEARFDGKLDVEDDYCRMTFRVSFTKTED